MNSATARHGSTSSSEAHGSVEDLVDMLGISSPTLLAVWAHPDDESYLGAGLMAEITRRGGQVVNVTATLGEHGSSDPDREPPEQLAARRGRELHEALTVLGVSHSAVLGYGDGACDEVPEALGARRIGSIIDEVRPDAVLTFGPDGVTGHPDHRAVARWTERAVAQRGHRVPLITTAAGAAWPAAAIAPMREIGAFWPGYPERMVEGPQWRLVLDGRHLDEKVAALSCHGSQIGPLQDALGVSQWRRLASVEAYRAANLAALRLFTPDLESAAA